MGSRLAVGTGSPPGSPKVACEAATLSPKHPKQCQTCPWGHPKIPQFHHGDYPTKQTRYKAGTGPALPHTTPFAHTEPVSAGSKRGIWGVFGAYSGRVGSVQFVCGHRERFTGTRLPDKARLTQNKARLTQRARCSLSPNLLSSSPARQAWKPLKVSFPNIPGFLQPPSPAAERRHSPLPPRHSGAVEKHSWGAGCCFS